MTTTLQKLGLTPVKGALIAVLAVGMGWVWSPLLFGDSKPPRRRAAASAERKYEPVAKPALRPSAPTPAPEPVLPEPILKLTLSEATRHDPFATPDWAPRPQVAGQTALPSSPSALQERFDSLSANGVAMLLISEQGQAVQIGDRTVQVGDVIDGFRVVEITAQGVKFVPDDQGDGHGA